MYIFLLLALALVEKAKGKHYLLGIGEIKRSISIGKEEGMNFISKHP